MLKKNIDFLEKDHKNLLNKLQITKEPSSSQIENAKNGQLTLTIERAGQKQYVHSSYNPGREVEALIKKYKDRIAKGTPLLFIGIGLGYQIEAFINEFHPEWVSIIEFEASTMKQGLSHFSLTEQINSKIKHLFVVENDNEYTDISNQIVQSVNHPPTIIVLPSYARLYEPHVQMFIESYNKALKTKKTHYAAHVTFQKRWTYNSLKNFTQLLKTPNLTVDIDSKNFKDKPAILVAAGPSLNEEFDNLKEIKKQKSAYIFSVGSAINALIEHGIYPDAAFTYDPTVRNQVVFEKVKERNIKDIPLIFGSSVGFETLEGYPGKLVHFITSQDFVSAYTIKHNDFEALDITIDAPSIAVITLQLLDFLGFNPIVLVGQNLAYVSNAEYASGIEYDHVKKELTQEELSTAIEVISVTGNTILSNDGYINMKESMEAILKNIHNKHVINTTKNGAAIKYTDYIPLNSIMQSFQPNSVNSDWVYSGQANYKLSYIKEKWEVLVRENTEFMNLVDSVKLVIAKIDQIVNARELKKLNRLFIKLDQEVEKILNSDYYKTFISSMVRFEYEIVSNELKEVRESVDLIKKAKVIVKQYERLMNEWEVSYRLIFSDVEKIYEEIKQL